VTATAERPVQCEASPKCAGPVTHLATSRNVPALRVCKEHAARFFASGWRVKKLEP
jgi:hypothetical protein